MTASGMVLLVGALAPPAAADPGVDPDVGPGTARGPMVGFVEGSPGTVDVGWSGPLVVAGFSMRDDFVYRLRVNGPEDYDFRRRFELQEGQSMREEVALDPVEAAGSYRARLSDDRGTVGTVTFRVAGEGSAEPLLTVVRGPAPVFLPRVRDGIDDVVRLRYAVSRAAGVTGTVVDRDGRVVHTVDLGRPAPGATNTWTWDGLVGGSPAATGRYRMRLDAVPDEGADAGSDAASASRPVRVASYRTGVTRRVARPGALTSSRSPGGCRLEGVGDRALAVDCRGARRGATLRYWFASGDRTARWRVAGDGTSSRTARRLGRGTAVVVRVPAGARWRTDGVVAAWRTRVLR